jgi:hypothetical protein
MGRSMSGHEISKVLWDRLIDHSMVEIMQRIDGPHLS